MANEHLNIPEEIWKAIPGFHGYEVSDHGRVRSYRKNGPSQKLNPFPKILKSFPDKNQYAKHTLAKDGNICYFKAHQLVLLAFVGPCPEGMEGCHEDGNPTNNYLSNLRWDSPKNNQDDRRKHGTDTYGFGEHHSQAKLKDDDVIEIRLLAMLGHKNADIAIMFHIKPGYVGDIIKRKTWKHI